MTEYYRKCTEITEIPAPDDLVQGSYQYDVVTLGTQGDYQRGMLMMSSADGFIPATSEGIAGADEVCILAENLSFTDGTASAGALFAGKFNPNRIILSYETEDDNHSELMEAIRSSLRLHNIFLQ